MSQVVDFYPLSPMQEGMLFHTLYAPDDGVYVTQVQLTFAAGEVDLALFAESWRWMVARHAALRTRFLWEGLEAPIQVVDREVELPVEWRDWRRLRPEEGRRRFADYRRSERARRFDLSRAPLARLGLVELPGGASRVVWTFHHIVLDGWSVALVLRELETVYRSLAAGSEPALPPARPYRDYIVWLKRQDLAAAEEHWRSVLAGFTAPTPLPADDEEREARPPLQGLQATLHHALPVAATAALAAWGRRAGLTLNTLAQGVWAILLGRYGGQRDVAFGTPVLGRPVDLPGADSIVGLFINTLVLRVDAAPDARLVPWLQELQAAWARSRRFDYSPLVKVQEWSAVPRGAPLFESLLNFTGSARPPGGASGPQPAGRGWAVETLPQSHVAVTMDVAVGEELGLLLRWDPRRFGEAWGARLLGHLAALFATLAGSPTAPDLRLSDLPMLSAAERQMVIREWNDTAVDRAKDPALLHARFAGWSAATPDAVALVCAGQAVSYGMLAQRIGALARRLGGFGGRGVGPETVVGVLMERSIEMLVALFAILEVGGAYLPLDPDHPPERLAFLVADGRVGLVLAQERLRGLLAGSPVAVLAVDGAQGTAAPPTIGGARVPCGTEPESLAYVIYTSGSTGRPKGAMVSHRAAANRLDWQQEAYRLSPADRVLQKTPFSFDVSVWELFWALSNGACLVVAPPGVHRDPDALLALVVREQVTDLHFVPSLLRFFLEAQGVAAAVSLRRVLASGEALGADLVERFHETLGAALHNLYGPTEAAVDVTSWACAEEEGGGVPIGRPIANLVIHILDASGRPAPVGIPGALHIGGTGLARGYLGRPDLTAERFVPDACAATPGERLYDSGDLARRRADGRIDYLGRLDHQVKVRGIRVEPGEIEGVLAEHPAVSQAAVVARDDGPAGRRLVAYVVAAPGGAPLDGEALRGFARERLPEALVPAVVVPLAAFPLTVSGKLDRRALPDPGLGAPALPARPREAARDELERALVETWEEILRRPIGIRDDFFDSGGHSLLAVRLMWMLHKLLGRRVPLALLVENRTVERLAAARRAPARADRRSPLVALQPEGDLSPFFCVHPIGGQVLCYADLARHLAPRQPLYGLQSPGLDEVGPRAPSIADLAASFLAAVRGVQPAGPYLLGGWSMGGIVAFEMARQLAAGGEEAALVAILDSWSPDIHRAVPDDAYLLSELVKDHAQRGVPPALRYEALRELAPQGRLRRVLEAAREAGLLGAAADLSWLRRSLQGYRARRVSLNRYRPAPYPGNLVLLRAAEADAELLATLARELGIDAADPLLGWGSYTTGTVAVETVPGNHSTLCSEPHVQALARSLESRIARALSGQEVCR